VKSLRSLIVRAASGMLLSAMCQMAPAEPLPYIPWGNAAEGATLIATLKSFSQIAAGNADLKERMARQRSGVAVVFVPGILGSELAGSDGKNIFGEVEDVPTLVSRLQLPETLVDETAESGITAGVLRSLGGMDFYGDAISAMEKWATDNGVGFVACGYDWRRDIRAGARDLDRCIARLSSQYKDLVLVAHSMGGIVTWVWAGKQARGEYASDRRVLQVTLLGSPLRGTCEIVRMIQTGYVQPKRDEQLQPNQNLKAWAKTTFESMVDAFKNGATARFTDGIRPLILSWPGALELSPPASDDGLSVSCVGVPAPLDATFGTPGTSYYDPEFWSLPAGQQMLRIGTGPQHHPAPPYVAKVLKKAKEFRKDFQPKELTYPAWLYASQIWLVPDKARYRAPYVSEPDEWSTDIGDGRVPWESATNRPDETVFRHIMGLNSVHGNLAGDPNFFDDYFSYRLPQALAAVWVSDLAREAVDRPQWMDALARTIKSGPDRAQVRVALEPKEAPQPTPLTQKALSAVADFNSKLCNLRGDCASTYEAARDKVKLAPSSRRETAALAQYGAVVRSLDSTDRGFSLAEGQRGLALARTQDWRAAAASLRRADSGMKELESAQVRLSGKENEFGAVVRRNLGKSFLESGQCKQAEPYLREAAETLSWAKDALTKPCNDYESGLQYCFDTGTYCRRRQ